MAADALTLSQLRRMAGVPDTEEWPDADLEDHYLALCLVPDEFGFEPEDEDYTDTYDLHRAAALIFRDRAAKVADVAYDTQVDMTKASRSQIIQNYLRMARFHEQHSYPVGGSVFAAFPNLEDEAGDNVSVDA